MQRQSLGSLGTKLHIHGVLGAKEENLTGEDQKRKNQASSLAAADEDNNESQKPHKSPPKPEKFNHLIPILTVLCVLLFYLSSHDPSQADLAQFDGFHRLSRPIDSTETVLAIQSLRNLQESKDRDRIIGFTGKSAVHRSHFPVMCYYACAFLSLPPSRPSMF
ncbi:uncharacterized protein LOC130770472 [Actinidia eriantha]|uniref:uncharacterized protein LOC130770472 n=1 Tax=Actinidia eriantha TaxID=165200 RepID=UPI002589E372|nr:uncharacterized protein LOC130770472 [Actinidia eriantha]